MEGTEAAAEPTLPRRRWTWKRTAVWGCAAGLVVALGMEATSVLFGRNFHALIPGRVYRSAQPGGSDLERAVRVCGIQTVINLRGCAPWMHWYQEECRATSQLGIAQEDVGLSSGRLPSVTEIRRLVEVLDRTEYPVLLHCRRGSDRTGLASAVVLLLQTDLSLAQARRALGPRYGHIPLSRPAYLDLFFDLYADWLGAHGLVHSPATFRRWVAEGDYASPWRCSVEPLDVPERLTADEPVGVRVRCHNTSSRSWRLKPGLNAGIHAGFQIYDAHDQLLTSGRSGLYDAEVPPGQSIDVTLVVTGPKRPGTYRLLVDMVDEQQCWFYQTGSEPLEAEITVK